MPNLRAEIAEEMVRDMLRILAADLRVKGRQALRQVNDTDARTTACREKIGIAALDEGLAFVGEQGAKALLMFRCKGVSGQHGLLPAMLEQKLRHQTVFAKRGRRHVHHDHGAVEAKLRDDGAVGGERLTQPTMIEAV